MGRAVRAGEYDSAGKYVILWDTEDAGGAGNPEGRGREVSNFFLILEDFYNHFISKQF